ncbi:MAG: methyltransferase domain-containing protein [Actinobacteria bacterium]|nr:methyltransferase domain-containing protein [Actinomycetota bacterium]
MTTVSYRSFTGTGAENYQRHFVPAIATPVSADLLRTADLQLGERVLDVACGTGVIARLAAEQVGSTGSVTGIDVAPDMIEVARGTPAPAEPQIDWHVGNATSLPFPDESYDAVLCQMGLMFIPDRVAAIREMRRVVRPGGRVVLNTPGAIQPTFEVMEQALVQHISPDLGGFVRAVFSIHDPDELATLLRDAGVVDVAASVSTVTLRLPAPRDFLWQYINLTPMGPLVAGAPEAAQSAMERQVVEGWQPFVVDGVTPTEQPMVLASGRR